MKILVILLILASCVPALAQGELFEKRDGCFLLIRLKDGSLLESANLARAKERFSPCSTFKIAAALMAFESGAMTPKTVFRWNGVREDREECNQDQAPASWMERSVVWVTQQITRQLGLSKVQKYLSVLKYGNQDFSGGITQAWLTSSLKISAQEQATLMGQLVRRKLPFSRQAQDQTVKILVRHTCPGAMLEGKTGSGRLANGLQLGWYVGHLKVNAEDYVVVMNISDREPGQTKGPAGLEARRLVKKRLSQMALWSEDSDQ